MVTSMVVVSLAKSVRRNMFSISFCIALSVTISTAQAQPACEYGDIRLAGGSTRFEGRIEVCLNNEWGTVCDDGLTSRSLYSIGRVVCKQLGLTSLGGILTTQTTSPNTTFLAGGMASYEVPIHLDNVVCTGMERGLIDCAHNGIGNENCRHIEDTGIRCRAAGPGCISNTVRLADSDSYNSGRVELCYEGLWSTVSDLTPEATNVICRQLGFSNTGARMQSFGSGFGNILSLDCDGSEINFSTCVVTRMGSYDHTRDSGVMCGYHTYTEPCICVNTSSTPGKDSMNVTNTTFAQSSRKETSNVLNSSVCLYSMNIIGILLGVTLVFLTGVITGWIMSCIVLTRKLRAKFSIQSTNNRTRADELGRDLEYSTSSTHGYANADIRPSADEWSGADCVLNEAYGRPFTDNNLTSRETPLTIVRNTADSGTRLPAGRQSLRNDHKESERNLEQSGCQSNVHYSYVASKVPSSNGHGFYPQEPLYELINEL